MFPEKIGSIACAFPWEVGRNCIGIPIYFVKSQRSKSVNPRFAQSDLGMSNALINPCFDQANLGVTTFLENSRFDCMQKQSNLEQNQTSVLF